jgi:hypothetical protein
MYLLVVERHIGRGSRRSEFLAFRDKVLARSQSGFGGASVNYGIINDLLGTIPDKLQKDLAIIAQVAPVLAPQLKGNPRQAKRFLNLVFLREQLAGAMALPIDMSVLAKLAALEYFDEDAFSRVATWNAEAQRVYIISDTTVVPPLLRPSLCSGGDGYQMVGGLVQGVRTFDMTTNPMADS